MVQFRRQDDPPQDLLDTLAQGLTEHSLPYTNGVPGFVDKVGVFAHDDDGELVGGGAGLVNWNWFYVSDLWVAEDARLKALLHALRAKASKTPPSPQALAAPAIKGSDVPLRDVLASENPSSLVAAIAKDRFKTSIREDFAPDRRTMDAKLVSWHLDRVERSATLWMPNGEQVQMLMFRRDGAWKLVPRW